VLRHTDRYVGRGNYERIGETTYVCIRIEVNLKTEPTISSETLVTFCNKTILIFTNTKTSVLPKDAKIFGYKSTKK
jgi:hypothetical protein